MCEIQTELKENKTQIMEFKHDKTRENAGVRGSFNSGMPLWYLQPGNQVHTGNSYIFLNSPKLMSQRIFLRVISFPE